MSGRRKVWYPSSMWSVWMVCALVATALSEVLPYTGITGTVIPIAAIIMMSVGVRRYRPPAPGAFYLVIAAHSMTVLGQLSTTASTVLAGRVRIPDLSPVFYSAAGPILIVGLIVLVRA